MVYVRALYNRQGALDVRMACRLKPTRCADEIAREGASPSGCGDALCSGWGLCSPAAGEGAGGSAARCIAVLPASSWWTSNIRAMFQGEVSLALTPPRRYSPDVQHIV